MTDVGGLLAALRTRGVTLRAEGDQIVIRPADRVTAEEKAMLKSHREEVLARLRTPGRSSSPEGPVRPVRAEPARPSPSTPATASQEVPPPDPAEVARLLQLPLPQLDRMVEVRMQWSPVPLWFVPDEVAADQLLSEGVSRGRVWTTQELLTLLALPDITQAGTRRIALAKLQFDATLDAVLPPPNTTPSRSPRRSASKATTSPTTSSAPSPAPSPPPSPWLPGLAPIPKEDF